MSEKIELKPCPFCGSDAILVSDFQKEDKGTDRCRTANVRCVNQSCLTWGYISDSCVGESEQKAIDAWNRRVSGGGRMFKAENYGMYADARLWCPKCDREMWHQIATPLAECCDCGESHEMTKDEIDIEGRKNSERIRGFCPSCGWRGECIVCKNRNNPTKEDANNE